MIGLYVHLPFCRNKCHYCSFVVSTKQQLSSVYIDALKQESIAKKNEFGNISTETLFLGGGTPSLLSPQELETILLFLNQYFPFQSSNIEKTLEVNPETITPEHARRWQELGFNRVSLGVQSFQDQWLLELGRKHTSIDITRGYELLRDAGFSNISLDLMFGLPGQTQEAWQEDLDMALKLNPEHLSIYNLTIEKGSKWYHHDLQFSNDVKDLHAAMYETARAIFSQAGFVHYEVASFSRDEKRSYHNQKYWNGSNYLGLGVGAHSMMNGARFSNTSSVDEYLENAKINHFEINSDPLTPSRRFREALAIGLRRIQEGVNLNELEQQWSHVLEPQTKACLLKLKEDGLIDFNPPHVRLTHRGVLFADFVASEVI